MKLRPYNIFVIVLGIVLWAIVAKMMFGAAIGGGWTWASGLIVLTTLLALWQVGCAYYDVLKRGKSPPTDPLA